MEFNASAIRFKEAGTQIGLMDGGVFAWGTAMTTGAGAGELVIKNGAWLRSVNSAATTTLPMIAITAGNSTMIACNSAELSLYLPSTRTTMGANGGAAALTALPVGYIDIDIGG